MEESLDVLSQPRVLQNNLAAGAASEQREKEEEFERLVAALRTPETEKEKLIHGVMKQVLRDMLFGEKGIEELGETGMNGHGRTDRELDAMVNEDGSPSLTKSERTLIGNKQSPSPSASKDHSPSNSDNSSDSRLTLPSDIDNRLTYRLGWPLLPILPVRTTYENVPKIISPHSQHLTEFRIILQTHKVPVDKIHVAHRVNPGTQLSKSTLTLCILIATTVSSTSGKIQPISSDSNALKALHALRTYILTSSLTLRVELIDTQAFSGFYTLPIIATEKPLIAFIKKKKHGIIQVLRECGGRSDR